MFIGWCCNFYPRPPRGGRLLAFCLGFGLSIISIHALREEGDPAATPSSTGRYDFYPRPPRGGRLVLGSVLVVAVIISIHALREEGDVPQTYRRSCPTDFYPRPPRGGRRIRGLHARGGLIYFYPRPPRGGRRHHRAADHAGRNFYPRPPRGGRRCRWGSSPGCVYFYPRPPRGGRPQPNEPNPPDGVFLSTPSARRATAKTETKSLFSYKLYNILHEFRRALIYNGSKNDPNHAKRLKNPVRRCRKNAENSPFAPGRKTQNNSRPSCSKGG